MTSICLCTKNRPIELQRCVASITISGGFAPGDEIVIIDDGDLSESTITKLRDVATAAGFRFLYHHKQVQDGLYASRRLASTLVGGDIVVFLDDDVEVLEGFASRLRSHYERDPRLMGVGGVDVIPTGTRAGFLFKRVFLLASGAPGQLSPTGMAGSRYKWRHEVQPFETEFMNGFCMTYRRTAIGQLRALPWLVGYSLGEDLIVSNQAARHGRLLIDPALQVVHHLSPTNRWDRVRLRSDDILLAPQRQRILRPTTAGGLLIYWSMLGRFIQALLKLRGREFASVLRAVLATTSPSPSDSGYAGRVQERSRTTGAEE